MAFEQKITATVPCTRAEIKIFDATGIYDASSNPGGYETPNPVPADFSAMTVVITIPAADFTASGASYPINVYPTLPTENPLVYYSVIPEDIGMVSKVSNGWYNMQSTGTYTGESGDVDITYNYDVLITSGFQCTVDQLLAGQCKCKCNRDELALEIQALILGAHAAFDCDQPYKASEILVQISRKVLQAECGC
jgi:hypothetical protein